jgi:hypothetical protein
MIHYNNILPSATTSHKSPLPFRFSTKIPCECIIVNMGDTCSTHPILLYLVPPVRIIKLLVVQISPSSSYFFPLIFKFFSISFSNNLSIYFEKIKSSHNVVTGKRRKHSCFLIRLFFLDKSIITYLYKLDYSLGYNRNKFRAISLCVKLQVNDYSI